MILKISPSQIERAPGKPRVPAGAAVAAALAGEPEALEDFIMAAMKRKALVQCHGDERKATKLVKDLLDGVEIHLEIS